MQKIDKILERLEDKSSAGYESWRRAQAVQKQRDNKVHMTTWSLTCILKYYIILYLLLTEFEVCTVSYGPSFFPFDL